MQLGIGSYTYPWAVGVPGHLPPAPMTAEHIVSQAAALGVRVVQLCDNLPPTEFAPENAHRLAEAARDMGVHLELGTRGLAPDHLHASLQVAVCLGSPVLRVVMDTTDNQPTPEEALRLLDQVLPEFAAREVTLAIENHDRFRAGTLATMVTSLSSPWVGICLDTVNSFGALEGPAAVIETLAPFTVSLHIKDFTIARVSHQMGFTIEGRPAGQGRLDVPPLLTAVARAGRDPNAILELWTPPESEVAQTVAKEARWAAASIAYLRTLIPG